MALCDMEHDRPRLEQRKITLASSFLRMQISANSYVLSLMSLTAIALLCSTAAAIWCWKGSTLAARAHLASFIASRALSIVVVNVSTRLSKSATSPISSATKASR